MCKKIILYFWIFFLFFCCLFLAQAIEITELELATLETLTSKQWQALEKSKTELKASGEAQMKSQETLRQAQGTNKRQLQEIQTLKVESLKLQQSIYKSATSYAQLEIEKVQKEAELKTKIRILNKTIGILVAIIAVIVLFNGIKIFLKIKGILR